MVFAHGNVAPMLVRLPHYQFSGAYRDVVRQFWNGKGVTLGELAKRISGSSDLYSHSGRRPHASVNFITAHDGFTLVDLVSYNSKVRLFKISHFQKKKKANQNAPAQ